MATDPTSFVKVCVNGARQLHEHPALTTDLTVLASDAARAIAAGASAIHVHPKDASGADSLAADDVDRWVTTFRDRCPGVPLGVTTGAWTVTDPAERVHAITAWRALPDFASVNWHEDGADVVAAALLERGVGVEAGIWHAEGLARWLDSPHRSACMRVLVELPSLEEARVATAADPLLEAVRAAEPHLPICLHGEDASAWTAARLALSRGLGTRIGLEDTLVMPDGSPARDNAALVECLVQTFGSTTS